jgi:sulfur relay (sulfurtransferase) DsrC/TusE family protein
MEYTSSTATNMTPKYEEWEIDEIIRYVRDTKNEKDAVQNLKMILKEYKKRIGFWELIKLLLNK